MSLDKFIEMQDEMHKEMTKDQGFDTMSASQTVVDEIAEEDVSVYKKDHEEELTAVKEVNDNIKYRYLSLLKDFDRNAAKPKKAPFTSPSDIKIQTDFMELIMEDKRVIAISGLIGAGKDTIADFLVEHNGYTKINYADKLKDSVAHMFDLDREMLEGNTDESRQWREEPLLFWSAEMGMEVTPRYLLQKFGTECMREGLYNDIWVAFVKKTILDNPSKKFIIPDCRFVNEGRMVKSMGGVVWRVRRGHEPEWLASAIRVNRDGWDGNATPDNDNPFTNGTYDVHASERGIMGFDFDVTLDNNASFNDLYSDVLAALIK